MYDIEFTAEANKDISKLKRSEPRAYKKLLTLLDELELHPTTGTGKPKKLKNEDGVYSRRITDKHRLLYSINEECIYSTYFSLL